MSITDSRTKSTLVGAVAISLGLIAIVAVCKSLGNDSLDIVLTEMLIRMVVVIGLYVFIGGSGIVSFGQVGFMCIGAYAAAWLTAEPTFKQIMLQGLPSFIQEGQYPMVVALLAAVILPAMIALLFGSVLVMLNGIAASIATFAFLIIVNNVYSNWDSATAGVSSIIGIPAVVGPWTALFFAVLSIAVAWLFQMSKVGLMLRASRDEEVATRASGIKVSRIRLCAFVLSSALCGLGGGLYAQMLGTLSVDTFYLNLTFITLAMLVVGGMKSISGAVAGVLLVTVVVQVLRIFEQGVGVGSMNIVLPQGGQEVGLGVLMALVLIFRPDGLSKGKELVFRWSTSKNKQKTRKVSAA